MTLNDTPLPRLNELIDATHRTITNPATPPDDLDELQEVQAGLEAIRAQRLAQVRVKVRSYVFAALRRAAIESTVEEPSIPLGDIKQVATQELELLLADDGLTLASALDGTAVP